MGLAAVIAPVMLGILSAPGWREMVLAPTTASGRLRQMGWSAAAAANLILNAWIQTSLAEEILFRGFLARRLIHRLGFHAGNVLQALIFAAVHLALFLALGGQELTPAWAAFLILAVGLNGWMLGYIKERAGNGSIIPGWIAHGLSNFTANVTVAFLWK